MGAPLKDASSRVETMTAPDRKTHARAGLDGRAVHDIGGLDFGAIDRHEHDLAQWEKRVDAMMILLYARKGAFKVDGMRRVIEDYGQQAYDSTTYYEKWIRALRNLMVEQEVLSAQSIDAKIAAVTAAEKAEGRAVAPGRVPWDKGLAPAQPARAGKKAPRASKS
jgi:Nitrile hydratase beta subunit